MIRSFDLETWLIQPGVITPPIVCGSTATLAMRRGELLTKAECFAQVPQWLEAGHEIITANGVYDFACIAAARPDLLPLIFAAYRRGQIKDTHLRQALLDIGRGTFLQDGAGAPLKAYSLKTCAAKMLGVFVEKENTWRLRYAELDGVPFNLWPEDAREYPRTDARLTLDLYLKQGEGQPDDPGIRNLALETYEGRASWALQLISTHGMRTDPAMVADVVEKVTAAHEAAQATFKRAGIYRAEGCCRNYETCPNGGLEQAPHLAIATCEGARMVKGALKLPAWPASQVGTRDTAWLKELVRRAYQGQPPTTDGGGISTDRDTLMESGDELLEAFGEAGTNEKEYSTYLTVIEQGAKIPINAEYNRIVKTTRCSCRKPNLQNLPRNGRTRECFCPRHGKVMISVDYPSLELVTLGQVLLWKFGRSELAKILQNGQDAHVNLASNLLGISYAEGLAMHKAKHPRMKQLRQAAKPVNYGMGGGMGAEKLTLYARQPSNGGIRFCIVAGAERCGEEIYVSEKLGKPLCRKCVQTATEFRKAWFDTLPEMYDYFEQVGIETEDPARSLLDVTVPAGEPTLWCAGRRFSEGANLRFQALAARMVKDALWRASEACYVLPDSPLYGSRLTADVHDELLAEADEDRAHGAGWELARIMTDTAAHWCPDIPCRPEPALMRRWFKAAERCEDAQGKLIPWWPAKWDWPADQEIMARDLARRAVKQ